MFEFQLGSISAVLDLDKNPFTKAVTGALKAAQVATGKINSALNSVSKALKLDETPFARKLKTASSLVRAFSASADRNFREIQLAKINLSTRALDRGLARALSDIRAFGQQADALAGKLLDPITRRTAELAGTFAARVLSPIQSGFQRAGNFIAQKWLEPVTTGLARFSGSVQARMVSVGQTVAQRLVEPITARLAGLVGVAKFVASKIQPVLSLGGAAGKAGASTLSFGLQALGRTGVEGILAAQRVFGGFVKVVTTGSKAAAATLRTSFAVASRAVQASFSVLGSLGSAAVAPFRALAGALTGLPGLLAGLAAGFSAVSIVQRGNEVEQLQIAFRNLASSLGLVADTMLAKLRDATRGTVSDLELMRQANNAILLGVVKSEEQFAELANAARRLGRAVGRSTTEGLNDLVVGIGRQSRLLLDNLGIILKVEQANERYAASVGKTASELTNAEAREAFLIATTEAVRQKMRDLGDDLLTNTDAWAAFSASISNTFSDISTAFNGSAIPKQLADFLDENRQKIGAFARFVGQSVSDIISDVATTVKGLFEGKISFGDLFAKASSIVSAFVIGLGDVAIAGVRVFFSKATLIALKLIVLLLAQVGNEINAGIVNLTTKAVGAAQKAAIKVKEFFGVLGADEAQQQIAAVEATVARAAGDIAAETAANADLIRDEINVTVADIAKEVAKESGIITESVKRALGGLAEASGDTADKIRKNFRQASLEAKSRLSELGNITLVGSLRPLESFYKLVVNLTGKAAQLDKFKNMPEEVRVKTENLLAVVKRLLEALNKQVIASNKARAAAEVGLDPENFIKFVQPLEDQIKSFRDVAGALDLSEGAASVAKFRAQIELMQQQFSPDQRRRVNDLFTSLQAVAGLRDTEAALADLNKELAQLKVTQATRNMTELGQALGAIAAKQAEIIRSSGGKPLGENILNVLDAQRIEVVKASLSGLKKELEDANFQLAQTGKGEAPARIAEIERRFVHFREELVKNKAVLEQTFGVDLAALIERFQRLFDGLKRTEISIIVKSNLKELSDGLEELDHRLKTVSLAPLQRELADLDRDVDRMLAQLRAAGASDQDTRQIEVERARAKRKIADIAATETARELAERVRDIRDGISDITLSPIEQELAELDRLADRRIEELRAANATPEKIETIDAQRDVAKVLAVRRAAEQQGVVLTREISTSVFTGLAEGFARGEKLSKTLTKTFAGLFEQSLNRTINRLADTIAREWGGAFGGVVGGFADAILGVVGLVLSSLQDKSSKAVDDFSKEIQSSEAVRGVVGGATNVAINKVAESLRVSMAPTEGLLRAIEINTRPLREALFGGGRRSELRNGILPLSTST